ncbi:biliverdin-producing heme oxygenase [Rhabdochromatium marinum]|uniref:biliverdin-producing heme oxygenase n=1 Tax=Rhabdochromatium marinum TaxID=48729 RepID=UPI001908987F|nr:biliverdin-producing heme oxygenase [Rhabdochromatium marinum]
MLTTDSPVGRPGALMNELRTRTAALHAATEALPLMRNLMAPEVDAAIYRAYLTAMASPYALIEPHLYARCSQALLIRLGVRPKLPALQRDLAALKIPLPPAHSDQSDDLLHLVRDEAEALGGLYVLEGATLGGRVISQRLKRNLGPQAETLPFDFLGTQADPSPAADWRHFSAALENEVCLQHHDPERILGAAVAVFDFLHQALSRSVSVSESRDWPQPEAAAARLRS